MTKKILSLLFLTLTVFFFVGCDKDDDSKSCMLMSAAGTDEDGVFATTFTYDGSKVISQSSSSTPASTGTTITRTINFTYGSNNNITEWTSGIFKIKYIYNGNNEIIKSEEYEGTTLDDQVEYEYTNGRVTKVQFYENTSSGFVKDGYEIFEYANSSTTGPSKVTYYMQSGTVSSTTAYEYDNKKSPLAALPALAKIYALNGNGSKNNVTKETFTYPGSTSTYETTYVNEFNGDGFLIKSTETTVDGSDTTTEVTTYTYTCS